MATHSENLQIKAALTRVEGRLQEEERLAKKVADGEAWMEKHDIDWEREYRDMEEKNTNRVVKLRQWKAELSKVREEIVEILTPVYEPVWRQWWEVSKIKNPKAEDELLYEKVNRTATTISDHLKQRMPAEAWADLEQTSRRYRFMTTEEMVEEMELTEIRCLDCETNHVTTVKQKDKLGRWLFWDRCNDCGTNVTVGGLWKKHTEVENPDEVPEYCTEEGRIKPPASQLSFDVEEAA
jgi:hypothetical protein